MAIKYIDFVNGDDTNDGSTWALAWKTLTTGATAARIAPGDELRIAKSPDPTSLGQTALWSGIDRIYTEITPTSSTNATPIVITKVGHGVVTGDIVQVYGHTTNTNANGKWKATRIDDNQFSLDNSVGNGVGGASGKFSVINHRVVQLTSAVTQDICNCDTAWTAGTGCTVTIEATIVKEGTGSAKIVCGTSGAGQILAKYALPASLDLSAYEQISFWFQNNAALAINNLEIRLYSDAACTTLVESLPIGACVGYGKMRPEVIDKAAPLSSTIQGIALYAVTSQAGKTYYLDNIIACKASSAVDSITLRSLIAKNIDNENGDHVFLGLQAINGNLLFLDNYAITYSNTGMGYSGVTENVITYKREGIVFDLASGNNQILNDQGTQASPIILSGGWNKVNDLLDGYTVMDGLANYTPGIYCYGKRYVNISYIQCSRFTYGFHYMSEYGYHTKINATNCGTAGIKAGNAFYLNIYMLNNIQGYDSESGVPICNSDGITCNNNTNGGIVLATSGMLDYTNLIANNNGTSGIQMSNYKYQIGLIKKCNFNRLYAVNVNGAALIYINQINECNYNNIGVYMASEYSRISLIKELNNNYIAIRMSNAANVIYKIEKMNYSTSASIDFNGTQNYNNVIYQIEEAIGINKPFVTGKPINCYIYKAVGSNHNLNGTLNAISLYLIECAIGGIVKTTNTTILDGRVFNHNYDNSGNHYIDTEYGYIENENVIRHTASGIAWKIAITNVLRTSIYPIKLTIAKVFCLAGSQAIMSCWVKKTHASDIGAKLIINHYINQTVTIDVATVASETTEWQQLIVNFTPTGDGVVEFEIEAYWVANEADEFVYVDDVSVAQLI